MATRRQFALGAVALSSTTIIPKFVFADDAAENAVEDVPNEDGLADFALAWDLKESGTVTLVAAAEDLPSGTAETYSNIKFSAAGEINDHFKKKVGSEFISWFNAKVAGRLNWDKKSIKGKESDFLAFWDQFLDQGPVSLMEFIAYMSVFINEVEGRLVNRSEATGTKDHPGISYLFDVVQRTDPKTGRIWRKQSYNVGELNRSAGLLFSENLYIKAHGNLALGKQLANTKVPVWFGSRYPVERFSVSQDEGDVGYILEADFYKFRGRGLIQTTWRENYKKIVKFIKEYDGSSEVLKKYKAQWSVYTDDDACTVSTNSDWDSLFGDAGKAVLCQAIRIHADRPKAIQYLPLASGTDGLNGTRKGSLVFMGNSIGGNGYGQRLKGRVRQICLALGT